MGPFFKKNIQIVCHPGQEADQVISSLTHMYTGNLPRNSSLISSLNDRSFEDDKMLNYLITDNTLILKELKSTYDEVVIGSTDADMAQLQRFGNVYIDSSTSGKKISSNLTAESVSRVRPDIIPLYKAIFGDSSDNVPDIGLKSRRQEVLEYMERNFKTFHDVEEFYESLVYERPSKFLDLYYLILPYRRDFIRNYDITCLKFYSFPYTVSFTDYDINQTIQKISFKSKVSNRYIKSGVELFPNQKEKCKRTFKAS